MSRLLDEANRASLVPEARPGALHPDVVLITIDALAGCVRIVTISRNRSCAVCGDAPSILGFEEDNYRPWEDDDDGDNGSCSDPA